MALALAAQGCGAPAQDEVVPIGLLLSYSGYLAANSTNSERALQMAIEAANDAGGVGGRRFRLLPRDTRTDVSKVAQPARELVEAGAALFIGPETASLAVSLLPIWEEHTVILPSFATSHAPFRKPDWWFLMGAGTARMACEIEAQLRADGRRRPLVLMDPNGYNSLLAWELTRTYGIRQMVLPANQGSNTSTVQPIIAADADAYVLAALPSAASSLLFALAAIGVLGDPRQWYLSPTLHTPALLQTIPKGALDGARGVAAGTVTDAADFRAAFERRWHDAPLDDAYAFYDAGAVAALALVRAVARDGTVPQGSGLSKHVLAVTHVEGLQVHWNELPVGFAELRQGREIEYVGLSGPMAFDTTGQTREANTKWWSIGGGAFFDIERRGDCH